MIKWLGEDTINFRKILNFLLCYLPDLTQISPHAGQHQAPIDFKIQIRDK